MAGHGFNYLLVLTANRALSPAGFGRFYAAWALLNILVTPATVVALLAIQHYSEAFQRRGIPALRVALDGLIRQIFPGMIVALLLTELLVYVLRFNSPDPAVLTLILPLAAASYFAVEIVRAALPAMLQSLWFGITWLIWCALQYLFGLGGLLLLRAPWAAYAGLLLANITTLAALAWILHFVYYSAEKPTNIPEGLSKLRFSQAVPFCTAYAAFVILNYADVIVAYRLLNESQLGFYSAAAVLGKIIMMATQPIVQLLLPLVVGSEHETIDRRKKVVKAGALTAGLAAVVIGLLWVGRGAVCGSQVGFRYCDPSLIFILALAGSCLAMLRVLVTAELANRRYWIAHMPVVAIVLFAVLAIPSASSSYRLAVSYVIVCGAALALAGITTATRVAVRSFVLGQQSSARS